MEADHDEQPDLDTHCSPQLDSVHRGLSIGARVEPPSEDELKIRIPRDIWHAEINRKDLELVLDDGIIRDADGDVVMDTTDRIDYTTNGVPTTQYVKTYGALYVHPVPHLLRQSIHFELLLSNASNAMVRIRPLTNSGMKYNRCLPSTSGREYCGTDEERKSIITSGMFLK